MPNTRPGISFNEEGVCQGCIAEEAKKRTNWEQRWTELEQLCDKHRGNVSNSDFDCVIAVSGGKDSHFQVHTLKEKLGMTPLLVTVEDNYSKTAAGVSNLKNISEAFGCGIFSYKPDIRIDKILSAHMMRKFGRPTWILEKLIYTVPIRVALWAKIPLVFYGEDISYVYGGKDAYEKASALNQIHNGVAADIPFDDILEAGITRKDLAMYSYPFKEANRFLEPYYLSYFVPWNSYSNYIFARSVGFTTLAHEWHREHDFDDFNQIDSIGYLVNGFFRYAKFGNGQATDMISRFIRYGLMTRQEGIDYLKSHDEGKFDQRAIEDFCSFIRISKREFLSVLDSFYNRELFEKNQFGEWVLKNPIWNMERKN